ncbi:S-layer homology domain-containing protein [Paenibacillus thalictri]|uniref:S-layer homology domain-containing protein n=1 Tax=Paenibacillus thalictri TaxID=2527873 RepID=A0A4Q9DK42_9BACL|nr:S-layer homology domain-containing protein [Paenibacillus thalictri]TBL72980.1 S-layer homology domain-containing protein [Paenibacillus thalictri]
MRESSYNFSKQNSQLPKDIRGGEKKVMKKSLSTILALAMTFSVFSSVALAADETSANDTSVDTTSADAAKSSADFSDLKDLDAATKAKFDALIAAGVFDGVGDGKFGVKDEMNRAQFAKVAALIFNLKVDTSLKTSSFSDVKSDDPANGYALPYIEAVKAAGITDGYGDGVYNPAGKVTKEQLATFLIRGLGKDKDAKATPGVTDSTVTDWAKGYVALALQLKLLSNGTDGKFGGQTNATRDLLVLGSYEAKQQYVPTFNGKYAIASFKATDADLLQLQLNGVLTDDAAKNFKVEIKKDGNVVTNYTTTWNDKKDTATFKFDTKFQNNEYSIAISGVSNIDDANKTAKVSTTVERIAKIEFLTAADTVPRTTNKLRIDFKATNQYGAKSKLSYNNFTINAGSNISVTGVSGEQAFYVQQPVKSGITNPTTNDSALERNDRISVTIIHEDSGATANKVFAVGESPNVAKIEVGDLLNSSNTKIDSVEANKDTYLGFQAYDQYGIPVEDSETLNRGITFYSSEGNVVRAAKDQNNNDSWFTGTSEIGSDAADLKFRYNKIESKDNITLTLIANGSGQTVTKTVKVNAPKTPASLEFGNYNYTLAENDRVTGDSGLDQKFFVPLIVKDAKGDLLTADEIAENAYKFTIYSTGSINLDTSYAVWNKDTQSNVPTAIVQSGEHKGQLAIGSVGYKGTAGATIQLLDTPNVRAQFSTNVAEKRRADKIAFSASPNKYMIQGTDNELKLKVYDQNGGEMKLDDTTVRVRMEFKSNTAPATGGYGLAVRSNEVAGTYVDPSNGTPAADATATAPAVDPATLGTPLAKGSKLLTTKKIALAPTVAGTVYAQRYDYTQPTQTNYTAGEYLFPLSQVFDKSFKFFTTASAQLGASYTFTAYLQTTKDNGTTWQDISNVTSNLEVLDTTKSNNKLTYEVFADKSINNTLLAARDYIGSNQLAAAAANNPGGAVTEATYVLNNYKKLAKEIKLRAKTSSGELVSVANGQIQSITSSNPKVVDIASNDADGKLQRFIIGLEAGTAKVTVTYKDGKGDFNSATLDVTTKNEGPSVTSIVATKSSNMIGKNEIATKLNGGGANSNLYAWDFNMMKKLTVKDQFGGEYVSDRSPLVLDGNGNILRGTLKDDNGNDGTGTWSVTGARKDIGGTDQFIQSHANLLNLTFYATDVVTTDGNAGTVTIDSTGKFTALSSNVSSFTINVFAPSGKSATTSIKVNQAY